MSYHRKILNISKPELITIINNSSGFYDIIRNITGRKYNNSSLSGTLEYVLESYNIDLNDYNKQKIFLSKKSITDRINNIIKNNNGKKLKDTKVLIGLLIKEKTLEYKCYGDGCNITNTWNGKAICLQLEHINGNCKDHNRNNLTLLCPNCHSQTDTFSKGSKDKIDAKFKSNKSIKRYNKPSV